MEYRHNKKLVRNAKHLRKNMTKEERHLWYDFLKNHTLRFQRQKIMGNFIVDFYCAEAKIVIELDGSQHYEDDGREYDEARTGFLKSYGMQVIRIPNNEVNKNFEGVCEYINYHIGQSLSHG